MSGLRGDYSGWNRPAVPAQEILDAIGVHIMTHARRSRFVLVPMFLAIAATVHADDGSFTRDGIVLHYHTAGSGSPVILLSGGPGFEVDYMLPVGDFLPASYQRVFLEQRGTGRSRVELTSDTMTIRNVVEDLEALRVHLKQERLFLVGHSWGGMLAMAYAAAHPDRIDRLILIGPGGPTLEFTQWFPDNIRMRLRPEDLEAERSWDDAEKRGVDADKAALEGIRAITPGYFFDREKGLAFAKQLTDGTVHVKVNQLLFDDMAKHYDSRPGLQKLNRPVLIVQGHQDPVGDKTAEDIHAAIKNSVLIYINKCGHFPWLEQPEALRKAISEFLR
jgi:proline iminopeptidase